MHAVIFGGSRGCGYFTAYYLLSASNRDWTVTLLLRDTSIIEKDPRLAPFIKEGRLRLLKGDATVEADVRRALTGGEVDLIVSSIGESRCLSCHGPEALSIGRNLHEPTLLFRGRADPQARCPRCLAGDSCWTVVPTSAPSP
jgi:NAD(P)-dependent dehydrogenase (short-subunit alcohol dehydrogenase family)